jgi:hypothetical protein
LGSFLQQLEQDRADSLRSAKLVRVEKEADEVMWSVVHAWNVSNRLADKLNINGWGNPAGKVLTRVQASYTFENLDSPDAKAIWTFSRKPALVPAIKGWE